ncbi:MAG: VRR-NUC domain-containing protein [Gammaproteobacteria bacterium]
MTTAGETTVVRISQPKIDPLDKKILCKAMCTCDKNPTIGSDGRRLKQNCVATTLKNYDATMRSVGGRSNYKQEVNYNMRTDPPSPIMDGADPTKRHDWLPGYIEKYMKGFKKGTGQIRRPDVVIVHDPNKPPTQDNIKQIVEMKFPPDELSAEQRLAYEDIAGSPTKLAKLEPSMCDCAKPDPDPPKIPVELIEKLAQAGKTILFLLGRGRIPRDPFGSPLPSPAY